MPSTLQTGHIGLNVTDLTRSIAFYRDVLRLDLVAESHDTERPFAFLGRDGAPVLTLWQQSTGAHDTAGPGLHHLSFQADSVEDVQAAEAVLKSLGARFAHDGLVPHAEGSTSGGIFFHDPDGIRLEIYAPKGLEGTEAPSAAPTCGFF